MTLQTRVTVLEKDIATLRSRMDNADVERDDISRQLAGLRAETHGWAQVTVRTGQKMDAAVELMQLIYADVSQTKETLAEHGSLLGEHGSILREHSDTLREHSDTLGEHGSLLREQGSILREQGDTLREQGSILREHGDMLREILARLDSQRS